MTNSYPIAGDKTLLCQKLRQLLRRSLTLRRQTRDLNKPVKGAQLGDLGRYPDFSCRMVYVGLFTGGGGFLSAPVLRGSGMDRSGGSGLTTEPGRKCERL